MAGYVEADVLCVSATMPERLATLERQLKSARAAERLALFVGGRGVDERTARKLGARWAGPDLRRATAALRKGRR
jgi:methanogenic corrinoid protein MtbC1